MPKDMTLFTRTVTLQAETSLVIDTGNTLIAQRSEELDKIHTNMESILSQSKVSVSEQRDYKTDSALHSSLDKRLKSIEKELNTHFKKITSLQTKSLKISGQITAFTSKDRTAIYHNAASNNTNISSILLSHKQSIAADIDKVSAVKDISLETEKMLIRCQFKDNLKRILTGMERLKKTIHLNFTTVEHDKPLLAQEKENLEALRASIVDITQIISSTTGAPFLFQSTSQKPQLQPAANDEPEESTLKVKLAL